MLEAYSGYIKHKEIVHNMISQVEDPKHTLEYDDNEARVLASFIDEHLSGHCHSQQFILQKAIKKFGSQGVRAAKDEVKQLHGRTCFKAIAIAELTRREKERAMDGLMFVTQKRSGEYKGRLAYNGKPTRGVD